MIKTEQKVSFSADSKTVFTEASEQGSFFRCGQNECNKSYAMIKAEQKVSFSADSKPIFMGI